MGGNASNNGSNNLSNNASSNLSENASNNLSNNLSGNISNNGSGNGSNNGSGNGSNNGSGNGSDNNSNNNSNNNSYNNSGNNCDTYTGVISGDVFKEPLDSIAQHINDTADRAGDSFVEVSNEVIKLVDHGNETLDKVGGEVIDASNKAGAMFDIAKQSIEHARQAAKTLLISGLTMVALFVAKKVFDNIAGSEDPTLHVIKAIERNLKRIADNSSASLINEECHDILDKIQDICFRYKGRKVFVLIPCSTILNRLSRLINDLMRLKSELEAEIATIDHAVDMKEIGKIRMWYRHKIYPVIRKLTNIENLAGVYSNIDDLFDAAVVARLLARDEDENESKESQDILDMSTVRSKTKNTFIFFIYTPVPIDFPDIIYVPPVGHYLLTANTSEHGEPLVRLGGILSTDRFGRTIRVAVEKTNFVHFHGKYPHEMKVWWSTDKGLIAHWPIPSPKGDMVAELSVDGNIGFINHPFHTTAVGSIGCGLTLLPVVPWMLISMVSCTWDGLLIRKRRVPCGVNCKHSVNNSSTWYHKECTPHNSLAVTFTKEHSRPYYDLEGTTLY